MNAKYLSAVLLTGAISLGASPTMADSSDAPQLNFSCQMSEGIPTTVARPVGSQQALPVFHWKQDALKHKSSSTPQELCESVTARLEDYSAQGYDLSKISFVGTQTQQLPAICATRGLNRDCRKLLFTLSPTEESRPEIVADQVVTAILDPRLQSNKIVFRDRGIQSTSYQVNLLDLLGLNFGTSKFFGK
ncbi:MAG: COP23 domain-containing protein [Pleurocapsa sp. MO_226.B13]|nr:COP23 domain-containing protein [Pleurocapsa sp. MO_226.B13]